MSWGKAGEAERGGAGGACAPSIPGPAVPCTDRGRGTTLALGRPGAVLEAGNHPSCPCPRSFHSDSPYPYT